LRLFFCRLNGACSFALLSGPINYAKSLVASERIYFTAVYFGSLAITLYAALIVRLLIFISYANPFLH